MKAKTITTQRKLTVRKRKRKALVPAAAGREVADAIDVKKQPEFIRFLQWCSLPAVFKGKPKAYLNEAGMRDAEVQELLELRTLGEFAERYKVRAATLTAWKAKIREHDLLGDTKEFFKALSGNVYAAFYDKTLQHGDAQRVRLWEEIFHGKQPEGSTPPVPAIFAPQFSQIIINLRDKYNADLRTAYENIIKERALPSTERVRPDSPDQRGGEKRTGDSSKGNESTPSKG